MEFKLRLESDRPTNGDLVLEAETPFSGVQFIEQVGKALRRSIDHVARGRHVTLGALVTYEVTVPQQMAIESGKFENSDTYTVILEHNLLSHFVFYSANVITGPAGRRCYPYTTNEASLISMIDELAFLDAWANTGYASRLMMAGNSVVNGEYTTSGGTGDTNSGNCVGCTGCTCGKDDTPHHHHGHRPPPPPKPPIIGNPSETPYVP
ncbi:MAG: hypothetical protein NC311_05795 [Muribaculaceae bacterium]|nr:hypothetical protein [Ruminococcus flavefaciens]MCM1295036.1 hypothetical protein [Muribaculaceae bacterium]